MQELVPALLGAAMGAGAALLWARSARRVLAVALAALAGVAWSLTVGEREPLLAAWDATQAALGAVAGIVLVRVARPRSSA